MPATVWSDEPLTEEERRRADESHEWVVGWFLSKYGAVYERRGHRSEDIAQLVRVHVCKAAQRFDPNFKVNGKPVRWSTYVCNTVKYALMTECNRKGQLIRPRHSGNGPETPVRVSLLPPDSSHLDSPRPDGGGVERADLVRTLVGALPPNYRSVVEMAYGLNGRIEMSMSEIADELGCTKQNANLLLHKAMAKLRRLAEQREG